MNTTANLISATPAVFLKVAQVFHNVSCATYVSGKFSQYTLPAFKRKTAVFYVFTYLYLYVLMLLILIHIKKQGNVCPVSRCFSQSYTSFLRLFLCNVYVWQVGAIHSADIQERNSGFFILDFHVFMPVCY